MCNSASVLMDTNSSILFIDAYDSFSQNLIALLTQETAAKITVVRIDTDVEAGFDTKFDDFAARFDAIVVGPGPGNPNDMRDVGILYRLVNAAATRAIPLLGVCLGFQVLCVRYGLPIERMKEPCHGHSKRILPVRKGGKWCRGVDLFQGIDLDNIWATCYNSLGLNMVNAHYEQTASRPGSSGTNASVSSTTSWTSSENGPALEVLAVDQEDNVMAVAHQQLPFCGVQFHPESCKSNEACSRIVQNWWMAAQTHNEHVRRRRGRTLSHSGAGNQDQLPYAETTRNNYHRQSQRYRATSASGAILSQLLEVSFTTGNKVQYKKFACSGTSEQISKYVHEASGQGAVVMLESTKKGRFSIYAVLSENKPQRAEGTCSNHQAAWQIQYRNSQVSITSSVFEKGYSDIPADTDAFWASLQAFLVHKKATEGPAETPFWGGFIGYLTYENGLSSLKINCDEVKPSMVPEISLVWAERSIIYDHHAQSVYVQSIRKDDQSFLDDMAYRLSSFSARSFDTLKSSPTMVSPLQELLDNAHFDLPERDQYYSQFHQCQSQLRAGNSYELCLTTDTTISIPKPQTFRAYELELYRNLHAHNPVPFGAFLKLGNVTILGTSPEQYMSWSRDGIIDMIPMKGTVKRSADMTLAQATAILSSPKESAENLMIADLIRHDLYNVVGSDSKVEVIKLCEVIEHETVYQLVSHVRAHAPQKTDSTDSDRQIQAIHYGLKALRETLPPGSMTGAPKKRSCEILLDLEQRNRGVYSGVLGYMDVGGGGNWNVCIRTAFRHDDEGRTKDDGEIERDIWHLGAGGAITVLSTAEGEWQEMMVKLNSVLQGFKTVKL